MLITESNVCKDICLKNKFWFYGNKVLFFAECPKIRLTNLKRIPKQAIFVTKSM